MLMFFLLFEWPSAFKESVNVTRAVRLLAWIILAGDNEVFTERGATLYVSSPRRRPRIKPSFVAPPESLDKLLADR